ncbi:MAG: hypothetical protein LWX83_13900 [Anaerolineae bacterium]|nr:hypothetical protein [Anaerolineae bacterium]
MNAEVDPAIYQKILEISQQLNTASDFDDALKKAVEGLREALNVERVQIILHRSEQDS